MKSNFDAIIIGAGASGMSAAIYLKRANIDFVMLENSTPGGQISRTQKVENYPGADMIDGPELALKMFQQTQNLGIEYRYGDVYAVTKEDDHFLVKTDVETLTTKALIIATGRKSKYLGVENEIKLSGKGISWCAICDGPFFKDKEVVVIGGGNSALEESLYLAKLCHKVTIIHRKDTFRADKSIQDKVLTIPNIETFFNGEVIKFNDIDNKLASVTVKNNITNTTSTIPCAGAFIYIGFGPMTDMLNSFKITDDQGYIITDENQRTKEPFIYACGDVVKKEVYQIVTATAEGAKAALSLKKDLGN